MSASVLARALIVLGALCSLACGEGRQRIAGAAADSTISPPADTALRRPVQSAVPQFHAVGTEPFWALDITGKELRFRTPAETSGRRFAPVPPLRSADTLRWTLRSRADSVDVRLWPGKCSDGMSDRAWDYQARVRIDTMSYRGCANQT